MPPDRQVATCPADDYATNTYRYLHILVRDIEHRQCASESPVDQLTGLGYADPVLPRQPSHFLRMMGVVEFEDPES